jgi:hypothetical protein
MFLYCCLASAPAFFLAGICTYKDPVPSFAAEKMFPSALLKNFLLLPRIGFVPRNLCGPCQSSGGFLLLPRKNQKFPCTTLLLISFAGERLFGWATRIRTWTVCVKGR